MNDYTRMKFEIWAKDALHLPLTRDGETYLYTKVREAWEAWLAARSEE